jgi:hypothetical protein
MAAQQNIGLTCSFSGNNVTNVIDIDLLEPKLIDTSVLYHVGQRSL